MPQPSPARPRHAVLTVVQGGAVRTGSSTTVGDLLDSDDSVGGDLAGSPDHLAATAPVRIAPATELAPVAARLAADVAILLARHGDRPQGDGSLLLPLALSVSLQRHDATPADLLQGMHLLRRALLQVAAADSDGAPVPLGAGEPVAACLQWGRYLHALLRRAAASAALPPARLAAATAAHLLERQGSAGRQPQLGR